MVLCPPESAIAIPSTFATLVGLGITQFKLFLLIIKFANPIGPHLIDPQLAQSLFPCCPPLVSSRVAVLSLLGFG